MEAQRIDENFSSKSSMFFGCLPPIYSPDGNSHSNALLKSTFFYSVPMI